MNEKGNSSEQLNILASNFARILIMQSSMKRIDESLDKGTKNVKRNKNNKSK